MLATPHSDVKLQIPVPSGAVTINGVVVGGGTATGELAVVVGEDAPGTIGVIADINAGVTGVQAFQTGSTLHLSSSSQAIVVDGLGAAYVKLDGMAPENKELRKASCKAGSNSSSPRSMRHCAMRRRSSRTRS